jgi:hypothetical protein
MLMRTTDSPINDGAPWSDDTEALTDLYLMTPQPGYDEIGRHLGRSEKAVYARIMRMRLAQMRSGAGKVRACMNRENCGRTIFSTGPGHRLCYACRQDTAMVCA